MTDQSKPKAYGFNVLELVETLFFLPLIAFFSYAVINKAKDDGVNWITLIMLPIILFMLYISIKRVYILLSTKIILYNDHFIYTSGKQKIEMKYECISVIWLRIGHAKIEDVYGNKLPLPISHVQSSKKIRELIMEKAINANKTEDIHDIGASNYIFYCKNCLKEFYIKAPTENCPKCGTKHPPQIGYYNLSFRLVKNDKINEKLMYVFWTVVVIIGFTLLFVHWLK